MANHLFPVHYWVCLVIEPELYLAPDKTAVKEWMSFEHKYNCRIDPNLPAKGKVRFIHACQNNHCEFISFSNFFCSAMVQLYSKTLQYDIGLLDKMILHLSSLRPQYKFSWFKFILLVDVLLFQCVYLWSKQMCRCFQLPMLKIPNKLATRMPQFRCKHSQTCSDVGSHGKTWIGGLYWNMVILSNTDYKTGTCYKGRLLYG